jgi:hypothetical protein
MTEKEYYGGIRRKLYGCNRAPEVTQTGGEVMKKVLLATTLLTGMTTGAMAGQGDSGVPLADGIKNGVDWQSEHMAGTNPLEALIWLIATPVVLAGAVIVDTGEKLTGN